MNKSCCALTGALRILVFGIILLSFSCVPSRQYKDVKAKADSTSAENTSMHTKIMELTVQNTELNASLEAMKKSMAAIENDTSAFGREIRLLKEKINELNAANKSLQENKEKMLAGSSAESKRLIEKLNETQIELQKKEDALHNSEKELAAKQAELLLREEKLKELQSILDRKDSVVKALRNTVSDALLGFKDMGLTVEQKNGKVYVSLEERLLFASGSTIVDPKGKEALKQLAKVLEKNKDISVMVEGHTDDVPMKGSGDIQDNWDLSVMRATAVVKILLSSASINEKRIAASGRGEFFPIDHSKTPEARKKNRRTEIILTPKLDELLKVLENN